MTLASAVTCSPSLGAPATGAPAERTHARERVPAAPAVCPDALPVEVASPRRAGGPAGPVRARDRAATRPPHDAGRAAPGAAAADAGAPGLLHHAQRVPLQ